MMRNFLCCFVLLWSFAGIAQTSAVHSEPYIYVLGTAQDAGYPQAGCEKECCQRVYKDPTKGRMVSSIALIDPVSKEQWIFDATPDFREQLKLLNDHVGSKGALPTGIFLTHAHIGHYTGLMHLGREVMGANEVPVYAMPKMSSYLETNGPWSQLVSLKNIQLKGLKDGVTVRLNERVSVTPLKVPHRDEFSETVGIKSKWGQKVPCLFPILINGNCGKKASFH